MNKIRKVKATMEIFTPEFMTSPRCCVYADVINDLIKKLNDGEIKAGSYEIEIYHTPHLLDELNEVTDVKHNDTHR